MIKSSMFLLIIISSVTSCMTPTSHNVSGVVTVYDEKGLHHKADFEYVKSSHNPEVDFLCVFTLQGCVFKFTDLIFIDYPTRDKELNALLKYKAKGRKYKITEVEREVTKSKVEEFEFYYEPYRDDGKEPKGVSLTHFNINLKKPDSGKESDQELRNLELIRNYQKKPDHHFIDFSVGMFIINDIRISLAIDLYALESIALNLKNSLSWNVGPSNQVGIKFKNDISQSRFGNLEFLSITPFYTEFSKSSEVTECTDAGSDIMNSYEKCITTLTSRINRGYGIETSAVFSSNVFFTLGARYDDEDENSTFWAEAGFSMGIFKKE